MHSAIEQALIEEVRGCLKMELRKSLKPEIEGDLRASMKREFESDVVLMNRLREQARADLVREFKADRGLRDEVREEVKRDVLCEVGREALVGKARAEVEMRTPSSLNGVEVVGSDVGVSVSVRAGTRRR